MFISIDIDAFYCGVEEHITPRLRDEPFCVVQKHIIATLSYPARQLGLKKLDNVNKVKKDFPSVQLVNGEDLTKYRKAGNEIYHWLQKTVGGLPIERLGLEEMRFDVRPIIQDVREMLPSLQTLKDWIQDPEFMDEMGGNGIGISIEDASSKTHFPNFFFKFDGHTWPSGYESLIESNDLDAYIAGNLASYIRDRMWLELGFSCSIGVATSKNIAKMVGNCNKPRGVTVLQPGSEQQFVRSVNARLVPGLGSACRHVLEADGSTKVDEILHNHDHGSFVAQVFPIVGSHSAETLWNLLNGNDSEGLQIKPFELPLQISVEESYRVACPSSEWPEEVGKLAAHLVEQTIVDWYDDNNREWNRVPVSCRVSVIFSNAPGKRRSKTTKYTWDLYDPPETVGHDLAELYIALLHQLVDNASPRLINIALVSA